MTPFFDRTSGTAEFLQARGQRGEGGRIQRQPGDHRHPLAAAPGHLASYTYARRGAAGTSGDIKSHGGGRWRGALWQRRRHGMCCLGPT